MERLELNLRRARQEQLRIMNTDPDRIEKRRERVRRYMRKECNRETARKYKRKWYQENRRRILRDVRRRHYEKGGRAGPYKIFINIRPSTRSRVPFQPVNEEEMNCELPIKIFI